MRAATCLAVGLAAFLAGCDSQVNDQVELEIKSLQARCEAFKRECDTLKDAIDNLKAENMNLKAANTALDRKQYGLGVENESLKQRVAASTQWIEELVKQIASAPAGSGTPTVATPPAADVAPAALPAPSAPTAPAAPVVAGPAPAPQGAPETKAELDQAVADREVRLTDLQHKIAPLQSKIMSLSRAAVDQQMIPPPGGGICTGCMDYPHPHFNYTRLDGTPVDGASDVMPMIYNFQHKHIGPAIKVGDFRTQHDKEEAVRKAKEELMPLLVERNALQKELDALKAKRGKLLSGQPAR